MAAASQSMKEQKEHERQPKGRGFSRSLFSGKAKVGDSAMAPLLGGGGGGDGDSDGLPPGVCTELVHGPRRPLDLPEDPEQLPQTIVYLCEKSGRRVGFLLSTPRCSSRTRTSKGFSSSRGGDAAVDHCRRRRARQAAAVAAHLRRLWRLPAAWIVHADRASAAVAAAGKEMPRRSLTPYEVRSTSSRASTSARRTACSMRTRLASSSASWAATARGGCQGGERPRTAVARREPRWACRCRAPESASVGTPTSGAAAAGAASRRRR